MTTEQTLAGTSEVTDTSAQTQSQAQEATRTYTQQEFDDAMAKMKSAVLKKALKPYEDLGDPDSLRTLKTEAEKRELEQATKRGEFDKIMSDLAQKKDAEIQRRDKIIEEFKVEQPLLSAAGEYRSVNPEQVKRLLRQSVRLNADGDVEVTDDKGSVRYSDDGKPLTVRDLVKEFLDANPHFIQAAPATTMTSHSLKATPAGKIDVSKLDLRNPEHRRLYAQAQKNKA